MSEKSPILKLASAAFEEITPSRSRSACHPAWSTCFRSEFFGEILDDLAE
jgi:hypothetical protein